MEASSRRLPADWEERWRREKESRKLDEEEEERRLKWITAYNDERSGTKRHQEVQMEEVLCFHEDSHPDQIFSTLEEMRQQKLLTDLTLWTEDGTGLLAHSLVLAAVSSVVRDQLGQSAQRDMCLTVTAEAEGLAALVEFAYTGAISGLSARSSLQVQAAAISLASPRVLELCREEEEQSETKDLKDDGRKQLSAGEQREISLGIIRTLWTERRGCDVTLVTPGDVLSAHRAALAAASGFFRGMFSSGMKESQQEWVSLPSVGCRELKALLCCTYSGSLSLGWDCVFELVCVALQLQFPQAISLCLRFLQQKLDVHNCLDVASFAEAYGIDDLRDLAEDFVLMHFLEVSTTPKFQDLAAQKLLRLLRSDALVAPSELTVFRAVVSWVEAEPAQRLPQAGDLMQAVRFSLMTFREFREVRAVILRMESSADAEVDLYKQALKEFGFCGSNPVGQHRVRRPKAALVLVGGDQLHPDTGQRLPSKELWFVNALRSGTGLVKEMEWRSLGEMPDPPRFRHGVGVIDGRLYVAGGCHFYAKSDITKSVYRWDPERDHWEALADLLEQRSNFPLVVQGNALYAFGGDKDINTNLQSVEKYCVETNSWSFCCPLDGTLSGHAASVLQGEVFISGGFDRRYRCLASTFQYHPVRGSTRVADMMADRARHCMESLSQRVYVAGGVSNQRGVYTDQLRCESLDTPLGVWTAFTPLPLPHVGAASAVLEHRLYVLGGYCQEDLSEARLTHRYDPVTLRWENMGKMPGAVSDLRACVLQLPDTLRC